MVCTGAFYKSAISIFHFHIKIQIYCHETNERIKTFTRFHDTVYGASYRSDGNLIIAGNEDGKLRLFDNDGRVPLRIFKGHTR